MNSRKILDKAVRGSSLRFNELVTLAQAFGFILQRVHGSHHIFCQTNVVGLLNIQNANREAESFQVRLLLQLAEAYDLELSEK